MQMEMSASRERESAAAAGFCYKSAYSSINISHLDGFNVSASAKEGKNGRGEMVKGQFSLESSTQLVCVSVQCLTAHLSQYSYFSLSLSM